MKLNYKLLVLALKVGAWLARRGSCPRELMRDALGDARIYEILNHGKESKYRGCKVMFRDGQWTW